MKIFKFYVDEVEDADKEKEKMMSTFALFFYFSDLMYIGYLITLRQPRVVFLKLKGCKFDPEEVVDTNFPKDKKRNVIRAKTLYKYLSYDSALCPVSTQNDAR